MGLFWHSLHHTHTHTIIKSVRSRRGVERSLNLLSIRRCQRDREILSHTIDILCVCSTRANMGRFLRFRRTQSAGWRMSTGMLSIVDGATSFGEIPSARRVCAFTHLIRKRPRQSSFSSINRAFSGRSFATNSFRFYVFRLTILCDRNQRFNFFISSHRADPL